MKLEGRKKEIFDILSERKRVSVSELSKLMYVTEMTVRRDLTEMEKQGLIKRYRGGAVFLPQSEQIPISQRVYLDEEQKRKLGKEAQKYLRDNSVVFIDSSSTCLFVISHIKKYSNIKIITNSVKALLVASELHIPCFLIGGDYYEEDMCFVGSVAEMYAQNVNVDVAFFSARGITEDGIITDPVMDQSAVRLHIMKNSGCNVFLFEKSKVGKKYTYTICNKDEVDEVIIN